MKFLIKEISPSRKELRVTLNSVDIDNNAHYILGTINSIFDEGTIDNKYIPSSLSSFSSIGPNPAIIRLVVAYLKDIIGTPSGFENTVLTTKDNQYISIVNITVDDIDLINLTSDIIPSLVIKLIDPLPSSVVKLDSISIERQVLTTQEQEVYYIPKSIPKPTLRGLDYDEGMKDEVGNSDIQKLEYQSYNDITSSFAHADKTIIGELFSRSGSDINLKVDYSNFENHIHFGSAVSKIENFKKKVSTIESYLVQVSQSLQLTSSTNANNLRETLFTKIQNEKNSFTSYENSLYYQGDTLGFKYNINIGKNYIDNTPLKTEKKLLNNSGFSLVHLASGSITGNGQIELFKDKYKVEDKPFYNWSGSFYLSFLMKGDESANGNIVWENYQEENIPKLPFDTLYSSSVLTPNIKSGSWQRYIYHASSSYWTPHSTNPIIGAPGSITDFTKGSSEIDIFNMSDKTGSHAVTFGSRYSNLATTVTSSGVPITGSVIPSGELFRIYINTDYSTNVTSSYLTDIKITKYNPSNFNPFAEIKATGSSDFKSWYGDQYASASSYDRDNPHSLINSLPEFLQNDTKMDNVTFRKFVNLMGEHFDIIKNYTDNYNLFFKKEYDKINSVPDNLLPVLANQYNWQFMIPFGKKEDGNLSKYYGSSISDVNSANVIKNNIWRNIINNINYMHKTKGTKNSIRALLNSYGFPADILKLREHGASMESADTSTLSDDVSNNLDGLGGTTGNQSFTTKTDKMVSYIIDTGSRKIGAEWRRDGVDADAVEFIFKPVKGTNTQTILHSSGSLSSGSLWDVILQPSGSTPHNIKSRLQFRLNNTLQGSESIGVDGNRVSMSTDYHNFKNQNFWNVLLQRTDGPSGSNNSDSQPELLISHSYQLAVGEQVGDKIKTLQIVSMSFGGSVYSQSAINWIGTGSRPDDSGNLIIGETYTGSIAEFRTWKTALSASKFKQHIYDKKSVVGNSVTDSQTNLIYHFRLNENWPSGSSSPKIKDSNTSNLKDYSINILSSALGHTPLYDIINDFDRIQFNVRTGGSLELSDNNIIIDNERRFIDNLNPTRPSFISVYDPLINKRKASSIVELVRSPQEVINDFILNQLGNFDFNDKFADPRDLYKAVHEDLETFAKDFFDYYDISLDINKYIRAQSVIFNKDLIKSLKRLVPARAAFSKIGIEIKPTYLERPKLTKNNKIEHTLIGVGPGDIKYHTTDPNDNTPISDWENNTFLGKKIEPSIYKTKNANIEIYSHTGSQYYDFTDQYELHKTKDAHISIASHTGSIPTLTVKSVPNRDINFSIASSTGSISWDFSNLEPLYTSKDIHIAVSSHTGSTPTLIEEFIPNRNAHISIASHTGSIPTLTVKSVPNRDTHISIASHTGSIPTLTERISYPYNSNLDISVGNQIDTGSILFDIEHRISNKIFIEISSATSSNPNLSIQFFDTRDGTLNFRGDETLSNNLNKSYDNLSDRWGTTENDVHFIHTDTGSLGKNNDYNTYHYESRYIFNMIGDVESVSGSYSSSKSAFETDFTGTVTSGIYTASKDFSNKTFVTSEIGLGNRPLGTTIEFRPTGSISFRGGKFLDETFVYPANHQFIVGTSKDSIDSLIYTGTQNQGGETIQTDSGFIDLSTDAFYYISTTGGSGYTIQYGT